MLGFGRLVPCALCALAAWPALAAPPARAVAAVARSSGLQVVASPDTLRLAEGSRATLRIVAGSTPPVLAASVGRIEFLHESSSGVYEAEYVPPESLDPQIAFVTALSAEGFGWVPIALSGIREVVVSAQRGTPVSVTVDGEVFGPVPADALGRATVRVVVPPGVRTARNGKKRIDLAVPEQRLIHAFVSSATADANAAADVTVGVLTVTERGRPRAGAPVALVASEGTVTPPVEVEPGVLEAHWKLAPGPVGQAVVTARLRDRPASVATAALERVPGPPRSLAIEVDRDRLVAGEGDEVTVTARVLDVAGNTTECATSLFADPGTVLEWERLGRGRYQGRVQVPKRRAGWRQLEIRVMASPALSAKRVIPLLPGPAREIRIEPDGDLHADGQGHEVRILVLDRDENRVDVAGVPSVTATRGTVTRANRHAPGDFRLSYRAPLAAADYDDLLQARLGPLTGEARLRVRALGGGLVLAPKAGYTLGTGGVRSPSGGAEMGLWTGALGQSFGLVLEGWVYVHSRSDTLQGMALKSEVRYLALEASLAWRRPLGGWMLWLGAGGGAVYNSARVSGIPGQPALTDSAWATGANGSVGWGRPLGRGTPFGEIKAAWQADPGRGLVRGSVRTLTFSLGYRFDVL